MLLRKNHTRQFFFFSGIDKNIDMKFSWQYYETFEGSIETFVLSKLSFKVKTRCLFKTQMNNGVDQKWSFIKYA